MGLAGAKAAQERTPVFLVIIDLSGYGQRTLWAVHTYQGVGGKIWTPGRWFSNRAKKASWQGIGGDNNCLGGRGGLQTTVGGLNLNREGTATEGYRKRGWGWAGRRRTEGRDRKEADRESLERHTAMICA